MDWWPETTKGRVAVVALAVGFVGFQALVAWFLISTGRGDLYEDGGGRGGPSGFILGGIVYIGLVGFGAALWYLVRQGGLPDADD